MPARALRVIVTRPAAQAVPWVDRLRALGVDAVALPLIDILALEDTAPVRQAWDDLPGCALAMFVSANAAEHFFAARPVAAAWPAGTLAGSTGPGTSAALLALGVPTGSLVEPGPDAPAFDSEALWARLSGRDWRGRHVLVVRGEEGRDWFADTVRAAGGHVSFVAAYRRGPPRLDDDARRLVSRALQEPDGHLWHFSSSEAARHLLALLTPDEARQLGQAQALATHPRIAESLQALGFGRVERVGSGPEAVAERVRSIQSEAS